MRREREASRAPPVRTAKVGLAAAVSVRRTDLLSPGGMQRRFGNQGTQLVLHAVASRTAPAPERAPTPRTEDPGKRLGSGPAQAAPVERASAAPAGEPAVASVAAPGSAPAAEGAPAVEGAKAPQAQLAEAAPAPVEKEATGAPAAKPAESAEPAPAPTPAQAVAPVAAQVRKRAGKARTHATAGPATEVAQASGKNPRIERSRDAAVATVVTIEGAKTGKVESFRDKLRQALQAALPKPTNADEAKRAKERGADEANAALAAELHTETEQATGGLPAAADPAAEVRPDDLPGPPEVALVPEEAGPAPAPVSVGPAVPEPAPPPDLSEDRAETDRAMADAGVTKQQMARSNEPEFTATLQAREDAEKEEAQRAQQFETGQSAILAKQQGQTAAMLSGGLAAIHGSRSAGLGLVAGTQTNTKSAEAKERERVTGIIERIKNKTREDVLQMLASMEARATYAFGEGLKLAEKAYENAFEEHKGGAWNWLTNWGDDWEELIEKAFVVGRREYDRIVSQTIDKVADIIETQLAFAKMRVERGRREVDDFVAGLEGESKRYGEEARLQIGSDFDAMDGEIDAKRDEMVTQLVDQYRESQKRVAALEEKLRSENKSLWQRIYDATVGIIKKILAFKDFLLNVLARVAQVVSAIIDDPIGFLGNLIDGIISGLERFKSNIGAHLKKGLLDWLFGAIEGAGIKLPETFDLKGIVDLVLQILGLTWENIRARAVKILGADTVAYLEKSWEIFQVLIREGPGGLWKMLVEKMGDIKEMILTQLGEWVKEKIIFAGIKWVLSLLNPVAAFIKACMAIYDIVKFFIERAEQIAALINAILDTLGALVRGNLAAMATAVENALARLVPVAIGFLASLLNLGGISDKIRNVITKLRAPVNAAIDWIIGKAAALVKKGAGFLAKEGGALVNKAIGATDKRTPEEKQRDLDRAAKSLRPLITPLLKRGISPAQLKPLLLAWRLRYRLSSLAIEGGAIVATVNPNVTLCEVWEFDEVEVFKMVDELAAEYLQLGTEAAVPVTTERRTRGGAEFDTDVIDLSEVRQPGAGAARASTKLGVTQEFVLAKQEDKRWSAGHSSAQRVYGRPTVKGIGSGGAAGPKGRSYDEIAADLKGEPVGEWMAYIIRTGKIPPGAEKHQAPLEELCGLLMIKEPSHSKGRHRRDLMYSIMAVDLMTGSEAKPIEEMVGPGDDKLHPAAFGGAQDAAKIVTKQIAAQSPPKRGKAPTAPDLDKLDDKARKDYNTRVRREREILLAWIKKHFSKLPRLTDRKPSIEQVKAWVRERIEEFLKGGEPAQPNVNAPQEAEIVE